MNLMTRLAAIGLIHCDFNEFNLLVMLLCCGQIYFVTWLLLGIFIFAPDKRIDSLTIRLRLSLIACNQQLIA
jgi:hypothetical protein